MGSDARLPGVINFCGRVGASTASKPNAQGAGYGDSYRTYSGGFPRRLRTLGGAALALLVIQLFVTSANLSQGDRPYTLGESSSAAGGSILRQLRLRSPATISNRRNTTSIYAFSLHQLRRPRNAQVQTRPAIPRSNSDLLPPGEAQTSVMLKLGARHHGQS